MSTVLRFTYNSANTNFDKNEIHRLVYSNVQNINLWQDVSGYYHLTLRKSSYKKIRIEFKTFYLSTWTKLNTLWGYVDTYFQPAALQCFYEYGIDTSSNRYVQMKRDDFQIRLNKGLYKADEIISLVFYETVPEGAAIILPETIGT